MINNSKVALKEGKFYIFIFIIFFSCTKNERADQNIVKSVSIETPIEKVFILDTTHVGLSTIIQDLEVPWEITWGPDNWIWFTEQKGKVSRVNPATGESKVLLHIKDVWFDRTPGLLGLALHPDFDKSPYVVVNYTTKKGDVAVSNLVRYTYAEDTLINPNVLSKIPADLGHSGARITIAPEGKVLWATGDALHSEWAQDTTKLNGKILRFNIDGSIPASNPIEGSPVWSWGYRNMQGLVYASNGNIYASEHGAATDDEINLINKGENYGWPDVTGFYDTPEEKEYHNQTLITEPLKAWTPTIAPAGLDYYSSGSIPELENALLLTTLKESDLRVLKLSKNGDKIISEKVLLNGMFGRIRDLCISPSGDVYIATSNRDWNPAEGFPKAGDDKIIRLFKVEQEAAIAYTKINAKEKSPNRLLETSGSTLYKQYCASCHKNDGRGVAGSFPPLKGADKVTGDKSSLIKMVLSGLKGVTNNEKMPAFKFMKDDELVDVLNYIRVEFGDKAGDITKEDVRQARENANG